MQIPVPDAIRRIADSEDRKLAWNFFVVFSRMEYALKRSGKYLNKGTEEAQPNWDRFASDHAKRFNPEASVELQAAVKYFQDQPPRKQLRVSDQMGWSDPQQYDGHEPLLIWLLRMIRCVRNNLFHGGKFPLIPISDPSRDREVLLNSLVVLNASLALDSEVKRQFFDGIDE
ncbi:MAG: hypothetical protein AAB654_13225 [Acidobacteriota bacterium]